MNQAQPRERVAHEARVCLPLPSVPRLSLWRSPRCAAREEYLKLVNLHPYSRNTSKTRRATQIQAREHHACGQTGISLSGARCLFDYECIRLHPQSQNKRFAVISCTDRPSKPSYDILWTVGDTAAAEGCEHPGHPTEE
jgi:hypothetical protein